MINKLGATMYEAINNSFGQCPCGAVAYDISKKPPAAHACHCNQCRRQSGYLSVSTHAKRESISFPKNEGLKWFQCFRI